MFYESKARGELPFNAMWVVQAAWAHPLWHEYAILLVDLTTPTAEPPVLRSPKATHEIQVWALDPEHPFNPEDKAFHPLSPANFAYQFTADSDEAAEKRVAAIAGLIEAGKLSPDTDFRRVWDNMFADGWTLRM